MASVMALQGKEAGVATTAFGCGADRAASKSNLLKKASMPTALGASRLFEEAVAAGAFCPVMRQQIAPKQMRYISWGQGTPALDGYLIAMAIGAPSE